MHILFIFCQYLQFPDFPWNFVKFIKFPDFSLTGKLDLTFPVFMCCHNSSVSVNDDHQFGL